MKRPGGLALVAVVAIMLGVAQIAVSLGYFDVAGLEFLRESWLLGDVATVATAVSYGIGIGLITLGIMGIVFAVGALGMRRWAWSVGLTAYLLGIAGAIFMLFMTQTAAVAAATGVVSALMAWYLSTDDVREAFGQETMIAGGHRPHAV